MESPKQKLEQLLKREVEVRQIAAGFVCLYIDHDLKNPKSLIGTTEEEAYEKLLKYLEQKPKLEG